MKYPYRARRMLSSGLWGIVAACSTSLATEQTLKNDSETDGSTATPCQCFVSGESIAAWLTAPVGGDIVAVQVLWKSSFGGAPDCQETSISILDGSTHPTPGAVLTNLSGGNAVIVAPILIDGLYNEHRFLDQAQTIPLSVAVSAGQTIAVSLEVLNTNAGGNPFLPSTTYDADGCQPGLNAVDAQPGGWADSCLLGVTGDWVIRAVLLRAKTPAPDPLVPVDGGNRYIRVEAPVSAAARGGGGGEEAIRVRFVSLDGYPEPADLYVAAPVAAPDEDISKLGQTFAAAPLACDPVFRDWSTHGIIAIYGAEIIPGSDYEVQRADAGCPDLADPACWSTPVSITTQKYGDVWPVWDFENISNQPDFLDISSLVRKFQASPSKCNAGPDFGAQCGTCGACVSACTDEGTCDGGDNDGLACDDDDGCPGNTCTGGVNDGLACVDPAGCPGGSCGGVCIACVITAPLKATCQLTTNIAFPTFPISFRDISRDVDAFSGADYSATNFGPCTCPSSVTCGRTACVAAINCEGFGGDGLCVNGFCGDKCGRCTP